MNWWSKLFSRRLAGDDFSASDELRNPALTLNPYGGLWTDQTNALQAYKVRAK
jgi:hypothetical protein